MRERRLSSKAEPVVGSWSGIRRYLGPELVEDMTAEERGGGGVSADGENATIQRADLVKRWAFIGLDSGSESGSDPQQGNKHRHCERP